MVNESVNTGETFAAAGPAKRDLAERGRDNGAIRPLPDVLWPVILTMEPKDASVCGSRAEPFATSNKIWPVQEAKESTRLRIMVMWF